MNNISNKNKSILGVLLIVTSSVIATVLPTKKDEFYGLPGSLEPSSGDDLVAFTCVITDNPTPNQECNASVTDPFDPFNQGTTNTTNFGPNGTSADEIGGFENSTSTGLNAPSANNTNLFRFQ